MFVCITAPPDDPAAIEIAERFTRDGFCPFGAEGAHMGFVKTLYRTDGGFMFVVEVNEPELEEHFQAMKGKRPGREH